MKAQTVKLSQWFKGEALVGWKKFIFGRRFYFSASEGQAIAEQKALALVEAAEALEQSGATGWTEEAIASALQPFNESEAAATLPTTGKAASVGLVRKGKGLTFHAAVDEWVKAQQVDTTKSEAWKAQLSYRGGMIKKGMGDRPLASIGAEQLAEVVKYWAGLPISAATKERIAVETAVNFIKATRLFFVWAADCGKWEECKRFERLFRVKRKAMLRNSDGQTSAPNLIPTFDVPTLHRLWQKANERQKLYVGLGLFCGWTQTELATATPDMFHLNEPQPYVERNRNKTDIFGRWPIPVELTAIIKKHLGKRNGLAFVTEDGKPLVWFRPNGNKVDAIWQSFRRLSRKQVKTNLTFKYLRKTGSDVVRKLAGLEMSQAFLAQSGKSVAERHYNNADFEKLQAVLVGWHKEIMPVLNQPLPPEPKVKQKRRTKAQMQAARLAVAATSLRSENVAA